MGMAAGQARLLSITARLSDNEQSGQSIAYAKERLADEADQINRAYNEAMNSTKLTMLTGFNGSEPQYTDISYSLLTDYNKSGIGKQYLVTDQRGKILVTDDIARAYKEGNGDFNYFLSHVNSSVTSGSIGSVNLNFYNAKGYSQNDIDFKSTSMTDEEKYAKVHDAWDKYLTSVGSGFSEIEHDFGNPSVQYSSSISTNLFGFYDYGMNPYVETQYVYANNIKTAVFVNDDGNGNTLVKDLPVGEYQIYQWAKPDGTPLFNGKPDSSSEEVPRYGFKFIDETGEEKAYLLTYTGDFTENGVVTPAGYYVWLENGDGSRTRATTLAENGEPMNIGVNSCDFIKDVEVYSGYTYVANLLGKKDWTYGTAAQPLNFEGTTQEQRELYDYAVEVTKAYTDYINRNNFLYVSLIPNGVVSIADDPEAAAAIEHYRNIFNQMQKFGYVTQADLNINLNVTKLGKDDNNWFEQQLRQGKLLLKTYDSSKGDFVTTTFAEDSNIQEVEDERKIAKATAEYTQAQEALERKDKKFDLKLKQLDTEHNALQTEYEAVKGVVDKNVEKTFNIFS